MPNRRDKSIYVSAAVSASHPFAALSSHAAFPKVTLLGPYYTRHRRGLDIAACCSFKKPVIRELSLESPRSRRLARAPPYCPSIYTPHVEEIFDCMH